MKNIILSLIIGILMPSVAFAQQENGQILQPTHIIGKRLDSVGQVTSVLESEFTYRDDGKPATFAIPDVELSTYYQYTGDFLQLEHTLHAGGHPLIMEDIEYTYEDGKVKTAFHGNNLFADNKYWLFIYGDDGRLIRKDTKGQYDSDYYEHVFYEYEDDYKTQVQDYWTNWPAQGWRHKSKNTYKYDDEFKLVTRLVEIYNAEEEITSRELRSYTYTPSGKQETLVKQNEIDGEWVNKSIMRYLYDDQDRVKEQQDGSWSASEGDWNITRRVEFEFLDDGHRYIVSFYKKSGEEWVWDEFNEQTILFGSKLYNQQRTLRVYHFAYGYGDGFGHINQFEMTMEYFEEPVYMNAEENEGTRCSVYPNPGRDRLKVEVLAENAVVRFYDLQGKMILARSFDFSAEIGTESWPAGIYFWEVWNGNQKEASGKWVKE